MTYFSRFPKVLYDINGTSPSRLQLATNIFARVKIRDIIKNNSLVYYTYSIKDTDTPEIIAHKYYGAATRHWIVLLANDIIDPFYDWPLPYEAWVKHLTDKYGTFEAAQTGISHHNKIITKTDSATGEETITKYRIDEETYDSLSNKTNVISLDDGNSVTIAITKEAVTYHDYEDELNEAKRIIKLIDKRYVNQIENEFKKLM